MLDSSTTKSYSSAQKGPEPNHRSLTDRGWLHWITTKGGGLQPNHKHSDAVAP